MVCNSVLGYLQTALTNSACKITCVDPSDGASVLISTLQNVDTLNGEFTVAIALNLSEEGLRPKIFVCIVNHHVFPFYVFIIIARFKIATTFFYK